MADPSIANIGYDDASDVTHSTAYVVLNTLVDEGQISEERAELLKQKFKDLHTRVLTVYKRDNLLLKRARQLSSELDGGRQRVFAKDEIARKDDAEIHRLKRELVDKQKELTAAQQRESILQVEALEYDRKKQNFILEREDAMAAEEARIRPKMEALQKEITELGKQVKDSIGKYDELKKQHEKLAKEEEACKAESENFGPALANAKQLYMNVEHDPERADKQLKLVMRTLTAARRDQTNIEERLKSQADTIIRLEQQRNNRVNDHAAAKANLQSIRNDIDAKRRTLATLNTSLEAELESRQSYQERMLELDHLINAARIAAREETDGIERIQREKAKQSRQFSTLEQSREDVRHEKQSVKEHIRSIQRELDQIVVKRKNLKKSIEASKADIEARTKRLLREKRKEKVFTDQANLVLEDITSVEDLMREKSQREEVKRRELVAIMSRRQEMSRESAREESRVALAKNELQMKEIELRECSRRKEEMTRRLNGVIATFQAVKRERLQRAAQIQALTQKMTEVAEKTKILENELEVLLRESALKEKELLKKKRLTTEGTQSCTNLRLEKNKQRKRLEKVADAEKDIKAQVRRLNTDIGTVEDMMSALQSSYEKAVESRNQTGIQLIDRNDELGLLVTKVKVQEQAIDEGIVLTNAKADEIQALKVRLADIQRELDVCHRSVPKVKQMEEELTELQEALDDERWRTEVLDNDLTDPSNPYRWRRIPQMNVNAAAVPKVTPPTGGAAVEATMAAERRTPAAIEAEASNGIPSVTERPASEAKDGVAVVASTAPKDVSDEFVRLQARCQELEQRLNGINEKLREKDLILAEVTELSERIGGQAESGREFTLALAKQVNQYQSGIRVKTRQMMATLSELSLFQASSNQLHQEVQRLEEVVEEAERRLQEGEVPFAEAEEEYQRAKVANQRYNELLTRRRDEKDFEEMKAKSVKTAAEPRPNAYIPDDDLGLPKPYGPFLPFKSSAAIKVPPPPEKAAASTPRGAAPSTSRRGPASSKRAPQPRPVQSHYRGDLDALRHSLDMETLRSSASFTRPGMERDPDQVRLSQRDGTFAHTH